ncbi:histidine phosphatase family protein [Paenibacillus sp. CAU 1782]
MEIIFIRHGHGEHLLDYPNRLETLHPGLTEYGKMQIHQLRNQLSFDSDDLILVSPSKRTIESALLLTGNSGFMISPLVGPRMFPQNPNLPFLKCDYIYTRDEITTTFRDIDILDFNLDCWGEGINRIEQTVFEGYARKLLNWIEGKYNITFIISHDGTITNYRILLGEKKLSRSDFLGEAGVYKMNL